MQKTLIFSQKQPRCMKNLINDNVFFNGLYILWRCLFLKDPCKKCIIRACCTKEIDCEAKRESLYYQYPYNNMIAPRLHAWAMLIVIVGWIIAGIIFIIRKFI